MLPATLSLPFAGSPAIASAVPRRWCLRERHAPSSDRGEYRNLAEAGVRVGRRLRGMNRDLESPSRQVAA